MNGTLGILALATSVGAWLLCSGCAAAGPAGPTGRIGLLEDCSTAEGWYELDRDGNRIAPRVKMEATDGLLYVHTNRARLRVARRHNWVAPGADWLTVLHKDYGQVDLDRYHYLVVTIKAKGSAVFFDVNGQTTKAGYTTGTTAIDLKHCDNEELRGRRNVRLSLDLHDNLTTLVLDEVKLVSELTEREKAGFVGRGLTIRNEGLTWRQCHGLAELQRRAETPPPNLDREEMVIFRDTATGAVTTRLTAAGGNDFFGEGGIWSADGAAIRFRSKGRGLKGVSIYFLNDGSVTSTGSGYWAQWSPAQPEKLLLVSRKGRRFFVSSWDRSTGRLAAITDFKVPLMGGYTEVKRFTRSGKLIIAFRETPHMYVVDTIDKTVKHITLSTRLKDASLSADEKYVSWANCYTYERRWRNLETGEEGICSSYSAGHGCGSVRSFGPHLKLLPTESISRTRTPGDKIRIWANWQNKVVTDYGSFTSDRKWIFTNGTRGDVGRQHVMVPSADPGAVLRVARYFTKFSWESTTYSRPSPDYTKLIYNENCFGPTQLMMVYTRRTDRPENVTLTGRRLNWQPPERCREIKGYNVYASKTSGRDFVRINEKPVTATFYELQDVTGYFAVTSVEHSRLESTFSHEVSREGGRTFYWQAERQQLTPPARRFYDGYCNDFQCVRINAESPEEEARDGTIAVDTGCVPPGTYAVWGLAKGEGKWTVNGKETRIDREDWQWVRLAGAFQAGKGRKLEISSRDDGLKLDTVMLTTEGFIPRAADPRDSTPPQAVKELQARLDRQTGYVTLSWAACGDRDVHHYSVYCGPDEGFQCSNASVIRSVFKNSITDAGMDIARPVYYKVVAYDGRWNASKPATAFVTVGAD